MIETQFRNFQIYFRHIVFDEVPGKNLEALLAIREGYTRCPAHQWMHVEKLVSMLLVSARDLNPEIHVLTTNILELGLRSASGLEKHLEFLRSWHEPFYLFPYGPPSSFVHTSLVISRTRLTYCRAYRDMGHFWPHVVHVSCSGGMLVT